MKAVTPIAILLIALSGSDTVQASAPPSPANHIDALVDAKLAQQNLAPNPPIDDATFLRRIYLDLIGRIPTLEESEAFYALPADGRDRRARLIDDLLASDGYVSHWFNYWADILRVRWRLGINETPAAVEYAYRLWLKRALRENLPYDDFVRELVTARGHFWENGAIGYYQRDRGMPLDNMSNTVRIFLGTRLECAQCHNHPFDRWTQMDYYRMAAFSYGMDSRGHTHPNREALRHHLEEEKADAIAEGAAEAALAELEKRHRSVLKAEENLHVRVRYITTRETDRTLQLPHDYAYDDAAPFDPVTARTLFGGKAELAPEPLESKSGDRQLIEAYADWMTAEDNPTFTRVIANRLWTQFFGTGIFEPVDEITEGTFVSHPELMDFLEQLMRDLDYDLKAYLAVLCNTRAYQRAASREDLALGEPCDFRGPRLRRMSAEQLWDSLVGLVLPGADRYSPDLRRHLETIDRYRSIYRNLANRPPKQYIATLVDLEDTMSRMNTERGRVTRQLAEARAAGDTKRLEQLKETERALTGEFGARIAAIQKMSPARETSASGASDPEPQPDLLAEFGYTEIAASLQSQPRTANGERRTENPVILQRPKPKYPKPPPGLDPEAFEAWRAGVRADYQAFLNVGSDWARASELRLPAPRGHFLRDFGQSDRQVIENANDQASVPQVLNLLNGPLAEALTNRFSVLGRRLHAVENPEEKVRLVFQALLTREPTEAEMAQVRAEAKRSGSGTVEGLVWIIVNTRQFLFVQ